MSEQFANNVNTTLSVAYVAGAGQITVTSATGFPTSGTFSVIITDAGNNFKLLFRVTSVAGAVFTGSAETTDVSVPTGNVYGTAIGVAAISQVMTDVLTKVYGEYSAITIPTTSILSTAVASGGASGISFANQVAGGMSGVVLQATATANDTNIVAQLQTVPATPYSFRMRFWPAGTYNQYQFGGGMALYDSVSGKFIIFGLFTRSQAPSSGPELRVAQFSNSSTYFGSPYETLTWGIPGRAGAIDLKIVDDGTHRTYYIIGDGIAADKVSTLQEATGTYITPTHAGIFIAPGHNQGPNGPIQITVFDWTQGTN